MIAEMAAAGKRPANGEEEERYKELEKLIGFQEGRIQNLQTSAFQLANYYFVFQGVIVAAISNTASLTCSDTWYIFSLSLIAAILNLFALFSIATKYVRAMDLHEQTWSEFNKAAVYLFPQNFPGSLEFTRDFSPGRGIRVTGGNPNRQWRDHFSQRRRYVVLAVCMALFLAFAAVTLAGPWLVTCKRDRRLRSHHHQHPNSNSDDCLKLCDQSGREMWNNIGRIDDAMQEFRHNCKQLTKIIHQKEKQIQFLETKALNLSMFYVASQLVIFLSNSSQCRKSWKPFFLSLSIAVAFGLNFAATVVKYARTKFEQDRNYIDQEENFQQMTQMKFKGAESMRVIDDHEARPGPGPGPRPDMFAVYQRCAHLGLTAAALLVITALVLHACRSSVCSYPI